MNYWKQNKNYIYVAAHRGLSARYPENTMEAFRAAGLEFYNECILANQIATGAMRAGRQFSAFRKVVKTHQNVLVFVKGSEKQIELGNYEYNVA